MRDTYEFPEEQPGAARTAGLRRLSRLTWRATQLSAVTAVGFATLFARTAPAHVWETAGVADGVTDGAVRAGWVTEGRLTADRVTVDVGTGGRAVWAPAGLPS